MRDVAEAVRCDGLYELSHVDFAVATAVELLKGVLDVLTHARIECGPAQHPEQILVLGDRAVAVGIRRIKQL